MRFVFAGALLALLACSAMASDMENSLAHSRELQSSDKDKCDPVKWCKLKVGKYAEPCGDKTCFLECWIVGGAKYKCGKDKYWHDGKKECRFPWEDGEGPKPKPEEPEEPEPDEPVDIEEFCEHKADGLYADPSEEKCFYSCKSNGCDYRDCCEDGQRFDESSKECVPIPPPIPSHPPKWCPMNLEKYCKSKKKGFYADRCGRSPCYCSCSGSQYTRFCCEGNTRWNHKSKKCEPRPAPKGCPTTVFEFCKGKKHDKYCDECDRSKRKYYKCGWPVHELLSCPFGQYFHKGRKSCVRP